MLLKENKIPLFILCLIGCLAIGGLGGLFTAQEIPNWYATLKKPSFNPPSYLFVPVWSLLYLLMGVSLYLILKERQSSIPKTQSIFSFSIQLILNFLWSFIFFKNHAIGLAFIEICALWLSIVWMMVAFYKINKVAMWLNLPYLFWVSFASILNLSIYLLNS